MISYTEAQNIISAHTRSFGKEELPLEQVLDRVLGEKIYADRDYPPFNRATMDGYAISSDDYKNGIHRFEIAETVFAGQLPSKKITAGQCYKIMTGAAVPPGTDCVIRREDTSESGGYMEVLAENCNPLQNIACKGEDFKAKETIISEPVTCTPPVISLLAATGKTTVVVEKLPGIAIITTGNEVVPVQHPVSPVQIRNSNSWLIKALLAKMRIEPVSVQHMEDDKQLIAEAFKKALESADIIITCGGVSAGDADFIPAVAEEAGIKKLFHKVAIKPGKPVWCGVTPAGGLMFGLPGNPFSCLVTFTLFIRHYLFGCFGLGAAKQLSFQLDKERIKKSNLDEFFPVQVQKGTSFVTPLVFNGSGDIQAALFADGIAVHPSTVMQLEKGSMVPCLQL